MTIPKKLLQEVLLSIDSGRLTQIAKSTFLRSQSLSADACVKKASTASNTCMIVLQLFQPELLKIAGILEVEPNGLGREALARKICNAIKNYDEFLEYRGVDVLSPAFTLRMLEKNEPLNKILIYMSQGIDAKKHRTWPEGMWLAWHCFATADLSMAKEANPAYAFGHRIACWPEPLLSCLKQVGAIKYADMFTSWQKVLFEGQHATLTGDAASNYAAKQFDRYDNAKSRKQWREGVKATGENLEQLTRKYLLEHPSLFQSE